MAEKVVGTERGKENTIGTEGWEGNAIWTDRVKENEIQGETSHTNPPRIITPIPPATRLQGVTRRLEGQSRIPSRYWSTGSGIPEEHASHHPQRRIPPAPR